MADAGDARRLREIVRRLRADYGVEVLEVPGCYERGVTWARVPVGIIDHHDASSRKSGEWGALGIITHGRPGLSGPLSQFQIARCLDDTPRLAAVAAGRANHAGRGGPHNPIPDNAGNSWAYGAECANDGVGEPYTWAAHYAHDALFRVVAEVCRFPVAHVIGHKEWAPTRKVDPRYDMNWRRAGVAGIRPRTTPGPAPDPREEDELTPDEKLQLSLIYAQLAGHGSKPNEFKGWPTWQGGTNEQLTLVDLARRNNVEVRQASNALRGLQAAVDKLAEAVAAGGGASADDLKQAVADALREGVVNVDIDVSGPGQ